MNVFRAALALTAGTLAAQAVSDRHKTTVGLGVALAVYWSRLGADPGEPTWPWLAGSGGTASPGPGEGGRDGQPTVVDVEVPVNYVGPER